MNDFSAGAEVADAALRVRILDQHAEHGVAVGVGVSRFLVQVVLDTHLDAHAAGAGRHHADRLRMAARVDQEEVATLPRNSFGHRHCFCRRRRLVEQRGVRQRQARQVAHGLLEDEQRLEPALRNLRLVRRVGGVPAGVFQHVPQDDRRRVRRGVPLADQAAAQDVLARDLPQPIERRRLAQALATAVPEAVEVQVAVEPDAGRHGLAHELVERVDAEQVEHVPPLGRIGPDVAAREGVQRREQGVDRRRVIGGNRRVGEGHAARS